jgi:hypothetical protein
MCKRDGADGADRHFSPEKWKNEKRFNLSFPWMPDIDLRRVGKFNLSKLHNNSYYACIPCSFLSATFLIQKMINASLQFIKE